MENYSAIKGNKVLMHVMTWMNLESMVSKEASNKGTALFIHEFYKMSEIGKSMQTESRFVVV